jgi:hypothetical protein
MATLWLSVKILVWLVVAIAWGYFIYLMFALHATLIGWYLGV